jgi:hypothetical protein
MIKIKMSALVIVICLFLVLLASFAALLGENRKIEDIVDAFFTNMKTKNYDAACKDFYAIKNNPAFQGIGPCSEACFLFELSLLKKYDLLSEDDYRVDMERNHFWIPYLGKSSVGVSVLMRAKGNRGIQPLFSNDSQNYLKDLIFVERKNGKWQISDIDIERTGISESFYQVKKELSLYSHMHETSSGFTVDTFAVSMKDILPIQRRILNYMFYKMGKMIHSKL